VELALLVAHLVLVKPQVVLLVQLLALLVPLESVLLLELVEQLLADSAEQQLPVAPQLVQ
jgi:hypothetical protein